MSKKEDAVQLKMSRHNCAQAVLCAYENETGLHAATLKKIGAGLGLGMGNMECTCGALSGAEIVLGLLKHHGKSVYPEASVLNERFRELCGSTVCKEIKGRDTGKILCSCEDCVKNAVGILEELL